MSVKQRGSGWSIKLVYNLYNLFGYKFIYYLMYPVSYFYYLKADNVKEALRIYYEKIGKEFSKKAHHEHLRHFAICMCDRFISLANPQDYDFDIEDREALEKELSQGGILLLSHFGGWASASNCFSGVNTKLNVVMQEAMMHSIKKIEDSIKKDNTSDINIIDTSKGGIAVTLEIAKALSKNELVAMMADRATSKKNSQKIDFFNKEASFNKNPFEIAYKTDKPLFALFICYLKPQKYKLDYVKIDIDKSKDMKDEVQRTMKEYVDRFEQNVNIYPQGWFNFYDFWRSDDN